MATYDVFRSENRASGRTDHVGTVEADNPEDALELAKAQFECSELCHLHIHEAEAKLVKVVYWAGTTQREQEVSSYKEALDLIDREHRNAFDPSFYEIATGEQLYDDGNGLIPEGGSVYVI